MKVSAPLLRFRRLALALILVLLPCQSQLADTAAFDNALKISLNDQTISLFWLSESGIPYQLQSSTDLQTWAPLGDIVFGTGNDISVSHPIGSEPRRFFRLKRLEGHVVFDEPARFLRIIGTHYPNKIIVSRNADGTILVNNGDIPISGPAPTVGSVTLLHILGREGDDVIILDDSQGPLPKTVVYGGDGNDTLIGSNERDVLDGGPGDDILIGNDEFDELIGGPGNDTFIGGRSTDLIFGEEGNDRLIWNPGDGSDQFNGGDGIDTVEVNGSDDGELFHVAANENYLSFERLAPAPFFIVLINCENLFLKMQGGDDQFFTTGDLTNRIHMILDAGPGNDFVYWAPDGGSSTIDGGEGYDTLEFIGTDGTENLEVSANGSRIQFKNDIPNMVLDAGSLEHLFVRALGGVDTFTANDLSGTELTSMNVNLSGLYSPVDGANDTITLHGSAGDDSIVAVPIANGIEVSGLHAAVQIIAPEPTDTIRIEGEGGDDIIDAQSFDSSRPVVLVGGSGNDILLGGAGADTLVGGDDDDILIGNVGVDSLDGGSGDNITIQEGINVHTGIVTVMGTEGDDVISISRDDTGALMANGAAIPNATVSNTQLIRVYGLGGADTIVFDEASGPLPRGLIAGGAGNDSLTGGSSGDFLFGGSGNDSLAGNGGIDLLFGGGNDDILTGGDGDDFAYGMSGDDQLVWLPGDGSDLNEGGAGMDTVQVFGSDDDEQFYLSDNGDRVRFERLTPTPFVLDIGSCEIFNLSANGGNDNFNASGNLAALIQILVDGGPGNDTLRGSDGDDFLIGGDGIDYIEGRQGADTIILGADFDVAIWYPGDGNDIIDGREGTDIVIVNGSAAAETYEVSANGTHVRVDLKIEDVELDLVDVDALNINPMGGRDFIFVNNLAGTSLAQLNADLSLTPDSNTGDSQPDTITVNGTPGPDAFTVFASSNGALDYVNVQGFIPNISITGSEVASDKLILNGLAGDDTFSIDPTASALIQVTTNQ